MSRKIRREVSPIRLHGPDVLALGGTGIALGFFSKAYVVCAVIFGGLLAYRYAVVRTKHGARIKAKRKEAERWHIGGVAERRTARSLAWRFAVRRIFTLGFAKYVVLHDRRVPGSAANVDHIIISRAGVTNVDTKSRQGKWNDEGGYLTYNGQNVNTTSTEWETEEIVKCLNRKFGASVIPVRSMWAVHSPQLPFLARMFGGTLIVPAKHVASTVANQPARITRGQINEVAEYLAKKFQKA